jgi:hypothetical protein
MWVEGRPGPSGGPGRPRWGLGNEPRSNDEERPADRTTDSVRLAGQGPSRQERGVGGDGVAPGVDGQDDGSVVEEHGVLLVSE